jgi:hypothetical protein
MRSEIEFRWGSWNNLQDSRFAAASWLHLENIYLLKPLEWRASHAKTPAGLAYLDFRPLYSALRLSMQVKSKAESYQPVGHKPRAVESQVQMASIHR